MRGDAESVELSPSGRSVRFVRGLLLGAALSGALWLLFGALLLLVGWWTN